MKYPITIDVSKLQSQYIAKDASKAVIARGKTPLKLLENLEFLIEQLSPDPDEGLELTAKAKQRLVAAKRMMEKGQYTSYTLEEIRKKYQL
mgnify:CR=1 FL=1